MIRAPNHRFEMCVRLRVTAGGRPAPLRARCGATRTPGFPRARSGARPSFGRRLSGGRGRPFRPGLAPRHAGLISRRALRRAPEEGSQPAHVLLADEIFAFVEVVAVVVHEDDVALIIDPGGRAASGLHLDPPLAVGVVDKFSKLPMFFRRFHHDYLNENSQSDIDYPHKPRLT